METIFMNTENINKSESSKHFYQFMTALILET